MICILTGYRIYDDNDDDDDDNDDNDDNDDDVTKNNLQDQQQPSPDICTETNAIGRRGGFLQPDKIHIKIFLITIILFTEIEPSSF